ncbi:gluconeogenesis factor YvcK family protein [Andreprevotia chitinilytica]|uniref:gluconeogenesis factor YvcK family protein n=1 Tax=Andreprevotia chitinilytica TaxID=396808 RepID=UPI000556651D|nr:uridine diphosphate-N-acetylglucosamine-binding protein YvcK [Andreprevotia chitinilytica]
MVREHHPRVVAIGGGTGLSAVLRGLKHFPVEITAIVTVADDGGSSGKLQREFRMPPPGDIRNVLVSLSEAESVISDLLQFRFATEEEHYLDGHSLGNLLIYAMYSLTHGDFVQAIENMGTVLNIKGRVYPVSPVATVLKAELLDGRIVTGESQLATQGSPIRRVFYDAPVTAVPAAVQAIRDADVIVFGPGSLYTSVLPNILLPEIAAAIEGNIHADKVYVCNIMTEAGETDGYSAADHLQALAEHGLSPVCKIIVNDEAIPEHVLARYRAENATVVRNDFERLEALGVQVIRSRIASFTDGIVRHDPIKTAASVYAIALDRL